ncbi:MAG: ComF family protein [Candidatus Nealsonbacteria bacterium]|nr:ComF family protein [Candidatus Nealsonbacteria bacterium]
MNLTELSTKLKDGLLDILLPRRCLGCGREGLYICKDCEIFLSEINMLEVGPPTKIMSVWEYEGIIEKAIYKIKFDGCYDIIEGLVEKALEKIELNLPEDTVITYVPMWKKKERQRGFNQSELIARQLGAVLRLAEHNLLEKKRDNQSQVGLNPKEREENVKGVFELSKPGFDQTKPGFRNVLLVDDVYTTGATMNECRKVLKKTGIRNIYGFTIAKKLRI